ncbi:MFS transporter [Leptospira kobayashii]|uniref:MFS transporter n=1 Tax=Leptospira kobayashii TaxID=1917830 RepID=A0ABN6KIR7_9LEPT|nr:MFS transporter [Leptospira kobayashii]BDA80469.1 MFS transporter [Leptospira kobayashii]
MEKDLLHPDHHPLHTIQKEKAIIFILAALQFLHILDFVIMMPLGPVFKESFKITASQFGLLVASYTLSAGIFGLIGTFFLDRFDRKPALLIVYFGFALGTLLCAFAPTFNTLIIARIVAGGFGGAIGTLVLSIIGDIIPVFRRGKATGIVMSAFSLASVIGIPIGLSLANKFGWHSPFLGLATLSFLLLPIAYKVLPDIRIHLDNKNLDESKWASIRTVFTRKSHYFSFAFMSTLMFGGFTIIPFLAPFLVSNVGMTKEQLPYLYFFGGLFTFFTSRYIGILSDRYGKYNTYAVLAVLAVIPVSVITTLGKTPLAVTLTITTFFMIIVSGRMVPAFALVTSSVEPKIRGSFMSFNSAIQQFASALASILAGYILTEEPGGELVNFEIVGMIAVFCLLFSVYLASKITIPNDGHAVKR